MTYKVYDVSMAIYEGMSVYKNKPEKQPKIRVVQDFDAGTVRESRLDIDMHCGTHVDSPLHMVQHGGTMETLPLERLTGAYRKQNQTQNKDNNTHTNLEANGVQDGEFLVLKTRNSLKEE